MNTDIFRRITTDLHAKIDLPVWVSTANYGTDEYWDRLSRALEREANDLMEFIRDHRSRDGYDIDIVREYMWKCRFCGFLYPEDYDGPIDCCDKAMDAAEEAKTTVKGK